MHDIKNAPDCANCQYKVNLLHNYNKYNVCLLQCPNPIKLKTPSVLHMFFKPNYGCAYLLEYLERGYTISEDEFVDSAIHYAKSYNSSVYNNGFSNRVRKYYKDVVAYRQWFNDNKNFMREVANNNTCNAFVPKKSITNSIPDKYPLI